MTALHPFQEVYEQTFKEHSEVARVESRMFIDEENELQNVTAVLRKSHDGEGGEVDTYYNYAHIATTKELYDDIDLSFIFLQMKR